MANPTCPRCSGTGIDPNTQGPCGPCGGDGTLDLLDPGMLEDQITSMLDDSGYLVWAVLYAGLINEMEKLDALDTKLDTLQADMDIIKPQIQALYDDLNP